MEFSRQEYWNGFPFPSLGDLPNPGIKPGSPVLEMATHSSVLAWRIPGMGSHRVGHDWSDLAAAAAPVLEADSYLELNKNKFCENMWNAVKAGFRKKLSFKCIY